MISAPTDERDVEVAVLGEALATVRLREPAAVRAMRESLERHGQLETLTIFAEGEGLEVVDGFKRLHAARALGWPAVRARVADVGRVEAKLLIPVLHAHRGLTELEEGWLVRALVRDDGLSQGVIAHRLGRHKSWVCRRLLLVEGLDAAVQADVRLGLLAPRAAVALGALPRGNQPAAAAVVIHRGLTVRQTVLLVAGVLDCAGDAERQAHLARRLEDRTTSPGSGPRPTRAARSEADWIAADICTVRQTSARLEARLGATPLGALGPGAAPLVVDALVALAPVLSALAHTIARVTGRKDAA